MLAVICGSAPRAGHVVFIPTGDAASPASTLTSAPISIGLPTGKTSFANMDIDKTYEVLLVRNQVFPVNDGLELARLTYTITRMKSLGLLKDQEPDLAQLVDRGPFMRVLGQLGTASQ
jgi:hypothetical protein